MTQKAKIETKPFVLSASSIRRVKAAVSLIQKKYDLTARRANNKDFIRICEGEEIDFFSLLGVSQSICFTFLSHGKIAKTIAFKKGDTAKANLTTKFYFVGALVIPSMHNAQKLLAKEISGKELDRKHGEAALFASLMLERK